MEMRQRPQNMNQNSISEKVYADFDIGQEAEFAQRG
jgi:hypothetical protein